MRTVFELFFFLWKVLKLFFVCILAHHEAIVRLDGLMTAEANNNMRKQEKWAEKEQMSYG